MLPRANLFQLFVTVHVMVRVWKLCACIHLTPYVSPSLVTSVTKLNVSVTVSWTVNTKLV